MWEWAGVGTMEKSQADTLSVVFHEKITKIEIKGFFINWSLLESS
jgi:hypothetical protein